MNEAKIMRKIEQEIVGQFVKDALAAGYRLGVSLERGYDLETMLIGSRDESEIMKEAFAGDECHIFVHPQDDGPLVVDGQLIVDGHVYCVMGNGSDVISDYTTNLESLLSGAKKISDGYDA